MNETAAEAFCYLMTTGKVPYVQCDYPFIHSVEDTLYRGILGWLLTPIECILVLAFWVCGLYIERDFTEAYLSVVGLIISAGTGLKLGCHATDIMFPRDAFITQIVNVGYTTVATSAQMTLLCGMPIFLWMALRMGTTRKQFYGCCTWLPFFVISFYSLAVSGTYYFLVEFIDNNILYAIIAPMLIGMAGTGCFISLSCPAITCCSGPKKTMDRLDPVVFDARSRLIWAVLYAIVAILPALGTFYCLVSLAFLVDTTDVLQVFVNEQANRVWNYFFPLLTLIILFAILPSYRDKILCGCRKQRFVKPVTMASLIAPVSVPTVTGATPTAPMYPMEEKKAYAQHVAPVA